MISIISAVADNNVIGIKNGLPWKLSGDLKYFSSVTTSHTVLMGLNTYKSIVGMIGKPLPNRTNVVLTFTKNPDFEVTQLTSWEEVLELAKNQNIFIIGGASVYAQALPYADKLYITHVHGKPDGDTFFPEIKKSEWGVVSKEPHMKDSKNEYDYTFTIYERRNKK